MTETVKAFIEKVVTLSLVTVNSKADRVLMTYVVLCDKIDIKNILCDKIDIHCIENITLWYNEKCSQKTENPC